MKKLVSLFLALLMLSGICAFAETYADVPTDELLRTMADIQMELNRRAAASADNKVLYEADGLRISIHSAAFRYGDLRITLLVENNTDNDVAVYYNKGTLNGWTTSMGFSSSNVTTAHTMRKDAYVTFNDPKAAADVSAIDQITNATISLELRITPPEGKRTTIKTPSVNLIYSAADGFVVVPAE